MAQFSVKKNAQFDEAFFSKETWPIIIAFKTKKNGNDYKNDFLALF